MPIEAQTAVRLPPFSSLLSQDYSIQLVHQSQALLGLGSLDPTRQATNEGQVFHPRQWGQSAQSSPMMRETQYNACKPLRSPIYQHGPSATPDPGFAPRYGGDVNRPLFFHQQQSSPPSLYTKPQSSSPPWSSPVPLFSTFSPSTTSSWHSFSDTNSSSFVPTMFDIGPCQNSQVGYSPHPVLQDSSRHNSHQDDGRLYKKNQKRIRTSRACQHCRSRKTRCDAIGGYLDQSTNPREFDISKEDMNGEDENVPSRVEMTVVIQPCTNCIRSGTKCVYSQRFLKRGPSKGYMRDLRRRLDVLESTIDGQYVLDKSNQDKQRPQARLLRLESSLAYLKAAQRERKKEDEEALSTTSLKRKRESTTKVQVKRLVLSSVSSSFRSPKGVGFALAEDSVRPSYLNRCLAVFNPINYTDLDHIDLDDGILTRAFKLLTQPLELDLAVTTTLAIRSPSQRTLSESDKISRQLPFQSQRLEQIVQQPLLYSTKVTKIDRTTNNLNFSFLSQAHLLPIYHAIADYVNQSNHKYGADHHHLVQTEAKNVINTFSKLDPQALTLTSIDQQKACAAFLLNTNTLSFFP